METKELKFYEYGQEMEKLGKLLDECVDGETGEITDENKLNQLEKLQEELASQLIKKSADVVKFYKNRSLFVEMAKAERDRLSDMIKACENKQDKFDGYILFCMNKIGVDKLETINGTIKVSKSKRVEILDPSKIPSEYIVSKITSSISKDSIKKDIKAGKEVEGAEIREHQNLSIK